MLSKAWDGVMSRQIFAIGALVAVVVLSLAAVGAAMYGTLTPNLIGFLAPTIATLLVLLKVEDTQKDVQKVERRVNGELDGRIRENVLSALEERRQNLQNGGAENER